LDKKLERIHPKQLKDRVKTAEEAAALVKDGMAIGVSGFTRAGDLKAIPQALADRANNGEDFKIDVFSGASLAEGDSIMQEAGIIRKRVPYQTDKVIRKAINSGDPLFTDQHLSHTSEMIRQGIYNIDYAILEAISITDDGMIIPSTSVGNSLAFVQKADRVIVEINMAQPELLEGVHDLYWPEEQGERNPILISKPNERIGSKGIAVDLDKIEAIVFTNEMDSPSNVVPPDDDTQKMADHILEFLQGEISDGRLTKELAPIQSGIGSVANAVLSGMKDYDFENLDVYSEVLQDAVFELIDAGKVKTASCSSITISQDKMDEVFGDFEKYKDKLVMRPQEISNHPEVVRRLGVIAINTALEFDIYGNVNSTHVTGTNMMNGIGGSGDFARNSRITIFITKSLAKDGDISSVVPFATHIDHTEHDVDVLVTEQGYADLRGLAPRERVPEIIENCAHPDYREQLWDYYNEAKERGGHTPHVIEKAFSWHANFVNNGTMRLSTEKTQ